MKYVEETNILSIACRIIQITQKISFIYKNTYRIKHQFVNLLYGVRFLSKTDPHSSKLHSTFANIIRKPLRIWYIKLHLNAIRLNFSTIPLKFDELLPQKRLSSSSLTCFSSYTVSSA